jgi:hypothetical protein
MVLLNLWILLITQYLTLLYGFQIFLSGHFDLIDGLPLSLCQHNVFQSVSRWFEVSQSKTKNHDLDQNNLSKILVAQLKLEQMGIR